MGKLYRAKYAYSKPEEKTEPLRKTVIYASVLRNREGSRDKTEAPEQRFPPRPVAIPYVAGTPQILDSHSLSLYVPVDSEIRGLHEWRPAIPESLSPFMNGCPSRLSGLFWYILNPYGIAVYLR